MIYNICVHCTVTSCMHICLCTIKIGTERIDAYDAFQFNHTWNVTHDRNIHHVAHFGDSGIQIAANYDRTRFIENKKLSTIKSHLVIMRQTCCWAYELQFNANLNRNIFFSLEILIFKVQYSRIYLSSYLYTFMQRNLSAGCYWINTFQYRIVLCSSKCCARVVAAAVVIMWII